MTDTSEMLDQLRQRMVRDVSHALQQVYHNDAHAPFLLLPVKRDSASRVSEQESKILMTQWLQANGHYYSIETPTTGQYRQSGVAELSARTDVTVYRDRDPASRILNVELKAGTSMVESFRKDFEKLLREGVRGLWFHTMTEAKPRTWMTLEEKISSAIEAVMEHATAARHVIDFAFCVLERRKVVEFTIDFGTDWQSIFQQSIRTAMALDIVNARGNWRAGERQNLAVQSPSAQTTTSSERGNEATGGKLRQLVLMPTLEPRTLLHLSTRGESYKLRYFNEIDRPLPWKAANCSSLSELLVAHPATLVIDVSRDGRDLTQHAYWSERIREVNIAHGLPGVTQD